MIKPKDKTSSKKSNIETVSATTSETAPKDARFCLLRAAVQLFAEKGLDGTSTRDIASKAKLNISLISYYFGGKEGLYHTVIKERVAYAKSEIENLLTNVDGTDVDSFKKFMRDFISIIVEEKIRDPYMSRIFDREKIQGFSESMQHFEMILSVIPKEIAKVFRKAQSAGIVKKEIHPETHFCLMFESISGFFAIQTAGCIFSKDVLQMPKQKEKLKQLIYQIFVEGILA